MKITPALALKHRQLTASDILFLREKKESGMTYEQAFEALLVELGKI